MASDTKSTSRKNYFELLEKFGAARKTAGECVAFLKAQGFTHGQARNAVYRYRVSREEYGEAPASASKQ